MASQSGDPVADRWSRAALGLYRANEEIRKLRAVIQTMAASQAEALRRAEKDTDKANLIGLVGWGVAIVFALLTVT